ncbi:hypothetical protein LSAT2_018562 [Lamellibrachia satsuma]|nr:hypothetical protein LSAT2_018562 [Lamellibrachia satsuma]
MDRLCNTTVVTLTNLNIHEPDWDGVEFLTVATFLQELPQRLESPPGREFPSRELDVSLPSYSVLSATTDVVSATKNNDQVVVKKDPGMVYGRNSSHENETREYSSRHQTFPVACPACSMSTSHDTLVQQLATRGGGMEQTEGDGSVPTSTPRIQSTTSRSQQAGPAQQQSPVPAVQHAPFCPCLSGSGGGGDDRWSHNQFRSEVNEQITLALLRLQQDMNTVVARVDSLEVKAERHNSWEMTTETSSGRRQSQVSV